MSVLLLRSLQNPSHTLERLVRRIRKAWVLSANLEFGSGGKKNQ